MRLFIFVFLWLLPFFVWAQEENCKYKITGNVLDNETQKPLHGCHITIKNTQNGTTTDINGNFVLKNICADSYQLHISCVGFRSIDTLVVINKSIVNKNTHLHFVLFPFAEALKEMSILAITENNDGQFRTIPTEKLEGEVLFKTSSESLGEVLKQINGISTWQTGASIAKPVLHGLHSQRLLILNNGVRLEAQQWGNEHAPEIDPLIAGKITVIKGAAGVRYGSDAIAGVVQVSPSEMRTTVGTNADIQLVGRSNGWGGTASAMVETAFDKKLSGLALRLQGTLKGIGNSQTPNYYLANTGYQEQNFSATLAYTKKQYGTELFVSNFNTKLGIFSGANVGNVSDLQEAIGRDRPLTPDIFSRQIERSYQHVNHTLFKYKCFYASDRIGKIELIGGVQHNKRAEYNVSIPFSNNIDVLNSAQTRFSLITHTLEAVWQHRKYANISGSVGISGITQSNIFEGTGFRSLIPNFGNNGAGIFWLEKWQKNKLTVEGGIRYDVRQLNIYRLDEQTQTTVSSHHNYQSMSFSAGVGYYLHEHLSANIYVGSAWRAPNAYELYSYGIHQTTASFEIGNENLQVERAYNTNISFQYDNEKWKIVTELYRNYVNSFIYSQPTLQYIRTLAGVFPTFAYLQADVVMSGADISVETPRLYHFWSKARTSILNAYNLSIDDYLIFMPANRIETGLYYEKETKSVFKKISTGISGLYVARQKNTPANSDYLAPPSDYFLLNLEANTAFSIYKTKLLVSVSVNNLFNTSYRDYLNRFRYYVDELGRNITLRIKYSF
jgi:iron complex outermembrane receptor protein